MVQRVRSEPSQAEEQAVKSDVQPYKASTNPETEVRSPDVTGAEQRQDPGGARLQGT